MLTNPQPQLLSTEQSGAYVHHWQITQHESIIIECLGMDYEGVGLNCPYAFVYTRSATEYRTYIATKQQVQSFYDQLNNRKSRADHSMIKWIDRNVAPLQDVSRKMHKEETAAYRANLRKNDPTKENKFENELPASTPEQEDSLQTEQEATFAIDEKMQKMVEDTLTLPNFCADTKVTELIVAEKQELKHPVFGSITRPTVSRTYGCFNLAGLIPVQSKTFYYKDMDTINPQPGGKIIVYNYKTNFVYDKKLLIKKITKSTKMNFGLGFNIQPQPQPLVVRQGDKVFKDGQPVMDNEHLNNKQVSLSFGMQKKHYELRIRAETRFKLIHELDGEPDIISMDPLS